MEKVIKNNRKFWRVGHNVIEKLIRELGERNPKIYVSAVGIEHCQCEIVGLSDDLLDAMLYWKEISEEMSEWKDSN
jgi:hypothetical protein